MTSHRLDGAIRRVQGCTARTRHPGRASRSRPGHMAIRDADANRHRWTGDHLCPLALAHRRPTRLGHPEDLFRDRSTRPIRPGRSALADSRRLRARKVAEVGFDFGADEKKRAPDLSRFREVWNRRYPAPNRLRTFAKNCGNLPHHQVTLRHFSISFLEAPVVPARRSCRSRTGRAFANRPIWEGLSNISALAGWLGAREDVGTGSGGKVGLR